MGVYARPAHCPTGKTVRLAAATGLWDKTAGRYLLPQATQDAAHPGDGGGDLAPTAFFNVAFRLNSQEPMPNPRDPAGSAFRPAWWRDAEQGAALARHDIGEFRAYVDFAKLAAGTDDESAVPHTGPFDRILQSHFEPAQGAD